jgi:hypothetical protein
MKKEEYELLLKDPLWLDKKKKILVRDKFTCRSCMQKNVILHVHHKLYIKDKKPWEYHSKHLISVCEPCHKIIHATQKIKIIDPAQKKTSKPPKNKKIALDILMLEKTLPASEKSLIERYESNPNAYRTKALPNMYVPKPKKVKIKKKSGRKPNGKNKMTQSILKHYRK